MYIELCVYIYATIYRLSRCSKAVQEPVHLIYCEICWPPIAGQAAPCAKQLHLRANATLAVWMALLKRGRGQTTTEKN